MNRHLAAATLLTIASTTAAADDQSLDAALGGALGGGLGALIGNELGGRNAAIVGGALGAGAMTAVTTDEPRREYRDYRGYREPARYERRYRYDDDHWRRHHRRSHFCPPGQGKKGNC